MPPSVHTFEDEPFAPPAPPSMEERLERIAALLGCLPVHADDWTTSDSDRLRSAYRIATGEACGLDRCPVCRRVAGAA